MVLDKLSIQTEHKRQKLTMFKKQPNEVQLVIDFIKAHPHEFGIGNHTIKHTKTDMEIWISNQPDHYGFYGDNWLRDMERNKFDKEGQRIFHKFITQFIEERIEAERKEKVAAKIRMLTNH